jgi:GT2 family glycosyltransferase
MQHIFVAVPTFKEPGTIGLLLASFASISPPGVSILIANGNPGDDTTDLIRAAAGKGQPVWEIPGNRSLFWSGLTNLAIRHALQAGGPDDYLMLMNADVTFTTDVFAAMRRKSRELGPCVLAALTSAHGRIVSSGASAKSWVLGMNRHPFAGEALSAVNPTQLVPVDFLPGRCTMIPLSAVRAAGGINEDRLPHYGGDYEFAWRLKRAGYPLFLFTGAVVECDVENTGNCVFHKRIPLGRRLRGLFSIRSADNPFYRTRYVWLVYPIHARPSATLVFLGKSILSVFLGGARIRALFPFSETGLAGSGTKLSIKQALNHA